MRARAIETGGDYWLRVRITPVRRLTGVPDGGRGYPGWTGRTRVRVVAVTTQPGRQAVATVEADRWVCVNTHWFRHNFARAMVDGRLRYRRRTRRWTVPVRDLLAPASTSAAAEAATTAEPALQVRQEGHAS